MSDQQPNPIEKKEPVTVRNAFNDFFSAVRNWFEDFMDLRDGMDREGTIIYIKTSKSMRGANAWMLMCSIMIASLGLDLNSGAVIIGAMLISPLMSPILGVGLGVAINDREVLYIALRHFLIAMVIAAVTSFLYFYLSPLNYGQITPEIKARTAPNLLDGLVAVFGGLAGIISTTRKDKSNAIPGVAIATALMPPLCVTGFGLVYGIRYGSWSIAYNSFYLFFLNSFIIALSAYFIIRLLGFPFRTYPNEKEARASRLIIGLFTILLLIPGIYTLINVTRDLAYNKRVSDYVDNYFRNECTEYKIFDVNQDSSLLVIELVNFNVTDSTEVHYDSLLRVEPFNLPNKLHVKLISNSRAGLERLEDMQFKLNDLSEMSGQIEQLRQQQQLQVEENRRLRNEMVVLKSDSLSFARLQKQVKAAFPDVQSISYGQLQSTDFSKTEQELPMFIVEWTPGYRNKAFKAQQARLDTFLRSTLTVDTLHVINIR